MGTAIGVISSADDAKTPDIISQNVRYDEVFSLMYAIDAASVNEAPVTLNLYYADPRDGAEIKKTYTADEPQIERIDGNDTLVYVFITEGVAAKALTKNFYVQAVDNTGAKSDVVRYSVLEYLNVRLYGGQTITESQKTLYEDVISFASSAQRVLINEKDADTTNDVPLASTYSLVEIKDGIILEDVDAARGYDQGVYPAGTKVYPYREGFTGKWNVITAGGSTQVDNCAEVTVDKYTKIVEYVPNVPGEYYANYGGLSFESYTNIKEAEVAQKLNRPSYNVKDPSSLPYTGTEDYIALYNDDGNKTMVFATQAATTKPGIYVMDTNGSTGNCYVFETKFKLDINADSAKEIASLAAPRVTYFLVGDATPNSGAPTGNESAAGLTGSGFAAIYTVLDGEGTPHYYLNHNNSKTANSDIITADNEITAGWHTMTAEIYQNGWVKVYLDGKYVDEAKCISNTDLNATSGFMFSNTNSVRIKYAASNSQGYLNNSSIYFDDMFFGKVDKTYVAE